MRQSLAILLLLAFTAYWTVLQTDPKVSLYVIAQIEMTADEAAAARAISSDIGVEVEVQSMGYRGQNLSWIGYSQVFPVAEVENDSTRFYSVKTEWQEHITWKKSIIRSPSDHSETLASVLLPSSLGQYVVPDVARLAIFHETTPKTTPLGIQSMFDSAFRNQIEHPPAYA